MRVSLDWLRLQTTHYYHVSLYCHFKRLRLFVYTCHQMRFQVLNMHQIRLRPGLRPGTRWGSSRRSPRPPSRMGMGIPPPHYPSPLDAFGVSLFAPSALRLRISSPPRILDRFTPMQTPANGSSSKCKAHIRLNVLGG